MSAGTLTIQYRFTTVDTHLGQLPDWVGMRRGIWSGGRDQPIIDSAITVLSCLSRLFRLTLLSSLCLPFYDR